MERSVFKLLITGQDDSEAVGEGHGRLRHLFGASWPDALTSLGTGQATCIAAEQSRRVAQRLRASFRRRREALSRRRRGLSCHGSRVICSRVAGFAPLPSVRPAGSRRVPLCQWCHGRHLQAAASSRRLAAPAWSAPAPANIVTTRCRRRPGEQRAVSSARGEQSRRVAQRLRAPFRRRREALSRRRRGLSCHGSRVIDFVGGFDRPAHRVVAGEGRGLCRTGRHGHDVSPCSWRASSARCRSRLAYNRAIGFSKYRIDSGGPSVFLFMSWVMTEMISFGCQP